MNWPVWDGCEAPGLGCPARAQLPGRRLAPAPVVRCRRWDRCCPADAYAITALKLPIWRLVTTGPRCHSSRYWETSESWGSLAADGVWCRQQGDRRRAERCCRLRPVGRGSEQ